MHVISQKRIWEAKELYKDTASALDAWYRIAKASTFENFAQLKAAFPSVDKVGDQYVFDVGGNKLRIIAKVKFRQGKIFIRQVLTHAQYSKVKLQ
jgi:mRNA interferase HigB